MEFIGKIPQGRDLLKTLIDLLAEQEGVEIEYEIIEREKRNGIARRTDKGNSEKRYT